MVPRLFQAESRQWRPSRKVKVPVRGPGFSPGNGTSITKFIVTGTDEVKQSDVVSDDNVLNRERRQLVVEMAQVEADVEVEIYLDLPDGYRHLKNKVGPLQKALHGRMPAEILWSKNFGGELTAEGFQRSQADPGVFWRRHLGKEVIIIVQRSTNAEPNAVIGAIGAENLRPGFSIKYLG